jgi:opacity protein-like surface antigen
MSQLVKDHSCKVGFVSSNTELEESEENEVSTSSTDLALAFGAEYELTKRLALRGEYQWVDSQNGGAGNMLSLGGVFRFQ